MGVGKLTMAVHSNIERPSLFLQGKQRVLSIVGANSPEADSPLRWQVISILLIAFAASLYRLADKSLFNDEAFSVEVARLAPGDMLSATMSTEPQPPLYYLAFSLWLRVAGYGEFSSRYFSVMAAIVLVAIIYRLAHMLAGPRGALFAAFVAAFNPFLIYYAQYVRIYTLAPALAGATALSFFYALRHGGRRRWALLVGLTVAGGYVSYFNLLPSLFLGAISLLQWLRLARGPEKDVWRRAVLAHVAAALLLLPWVPVTWHFLTSLAPGVPRWRVFMGPTEMAQKTLLAFALGHAVDLKGLPWLSWGALVPGAVWVAGLTRTRQVGKLLSGRLVTLILLGYQVFPLAVFLALSPIEPLFHERYAMITFPVFVATASLALRWRSEKASSGRSFHEGLPDLLPRLRAFIPVVLGVLFIALVAGQVYGLAGWYLDKRFAKDDFRAMIGYMEPRLRRGDVVLISAGYVRPSVEYYLRTAPDWRGPLTDFPAAPAGLAVVQVGQVGEDADEVLSAVPADAYYSWLSQSQARQALGKLSRAYQRIWLVRVYDTVNDPQSLVLPWLRENLFELEDHLFAGTSYPQLYLFSSRRPPDRSLPPIETSRRVDLGGNIEFLGHDLAARQVQEDDLVKVRLYWRAAARPDMDYVVFVHLLDFQRRQLAGVDNQPMKGRYPTSRWQPGEVVGDDFDLPVPPGAPPGLYTLEVGMYNPTTGQRLQSGLDVDRIVIRRPVALTPGAEPRSNTLGTIELAGVEVAREARAGTSLDLKLFWRALAKQDRAYTVFVHLLEAHGALVAQGDGPPAGGAFPTDAWPPGDLVEDSRDLRLTGLGPGSYRLLVGLYDLATGQRLKSAEGTDTIELATIRLNSG